MRHLPLDLAPFSVRREWYRVRPVARVVAVAGLLLCMVAGLRIHGLLSRLDTLDAEMSRITERAQRSAHAASHVSRDPIDPKQSAAVNAAIARLNMPWDAMLDAIEAATPSQIALLSITPEPGRSMLRIEGECAGSKDMIDFLTSLEQQPLFGNVNLVKHELTKDGTENVLRFLVELQWRGTAS